MARPSAKLIAAAAVALLVACCFAIGFQTTFLAISAVLLTIWLNMDILVAKLICWAIGNIPKRYQWTMDRVKIRPSWSEKDGGWSEIRIINWTWHNAIGFDDDSVERDAAFLLHIDELILRLKLSSIPGALTEHKSIEISLLRATGLRFNTHRNKLGALNLWQALDLPDDDVNVQSFTSQAWKYGGMHDDDGETSPASANSLPPPGAEIAPLPPISTAATRAAAGFWKPEWGPRPVADGGDMTPPSRSPSTGRSRAQRGKELEQPLLPEKKYVEEPIGHPRRRPRWGVPVRFDIHRIHLVDIHLWVLDLMLLDAHTTAQRMDRDKVRIGVHSLNISRQRLEAGDDRRSGSVDDVHGVYLGELIWVIVAEVIPLVVKRAPGAFGRTAAVATGLAIKDATKRFGARTVEAAHHLGHNIKEALHMHHHHHEEQRQAGPGTTVHVHVIAGKQVTRKGYSVNSHAFIELLSSTGATIAEARSEPQMWTKVPKWNETFELGPATSAHDMVRVTLYHQKSRQVVGLTTHGKEMPERFIGEVVLPLKSLLIRDAVIAEGGEVVGWFQLNDHRGLRQGIPCSGQIKLGLRVTGSELLPRVDSGHLNDSDHTKSDWAILR